MNRIMKLWSVKGKRLAKKTYGMVEAEEIDVDRFLGQTATQLKADNEKLTESQINNFSRRAKLDTSRPGLSRKSVTGRMHQFKSVNDVIESHEPSIPGKSMHDRIHLIALCHMVMNLSGNETLTEHASAILETTTLDNRL